MPRNTRFNNDWLEATDSNGTVIRNWCTVKDKKDAFCICCSKTIDYRNRGKDQLLQHAASKIHKKQVLIKLSSKQTKLTSCIANDNKFLTLSTSSPTQQHKLSLSDRTTKAEIIWALKVAECGLTYSSCNNLKTEFAEMFEDSEIAANFSLSKSKISYTISHGLGPFFHEELITDLITSKSLYTLSFDETTNNACDKQLDIYLRWWKADEGIKSSYYSTKILGHATADIMKKSILDLLERDKIDKNKLLMIGCDGPNVNKKLLNDMDSTLKKIGHPGLIRIGSCNLHIVHNSFGHGLKVSSWNIEEFHNAVYKHFHKFPARKEELKEIQSGLLLNEREMLRYVGGRWLCFLPVFKRSVEQWKALQDYFTDQTTESGGFYYKVIITFLENPLSLPRLLFLISVGDIFSKFLSFMQSNQPLIHLLHDELTELLKLLLSRFVKPDLLKNASGKHLIEIDLEKPSNLLEAKKINVGSRTSEKLQQLTADQKSQFFAEVKLFLKAVSLYLFKRVPLANTLLQSVVCLHPLMRTKPESKQLILNVAQCMPIVVKKQNLDKLQDEWTVYATIDISEESFILSKNMNNSGESEIKWKRIDEYWISVLKATTTLGFPKYPLLGSLVRAALTLSHGQANVERGFSINNNIVTQGRSSLKETSINGLRTLQDVVSNYCGTTKVPITIRTLLAYRSANRNYKDELKACTAFPDKCKQKDYEVNKRKLDVLKEIEIKRKKKQLTEDVNSSRSLIHEANSRLLSACKTKDMDEVLAAQALLESGDMMLQAASDALENLDRQ